ncbi:MAG: acetyl-CoA synthase subunit gamma [Elusimicrobia bacterium]|nr:acetyl-CoA synthase subunit gamma [Elusimicrobiota bacterium]
MSKEPPACSCCSSVGPSAQASAAGTAKGSSQARVVDSELRWPDILGAWKARWGIGRMDYKVEPGLYALGRPDGDSPVFVSANYKMSFDRLRAALAGMDGWILVLDTKGINVWCAAGKGTFGTEELIGRLTSTRLADKVAHRVLIVPQLGAVGVRGVEVASRSRFRVVFGPVRAEDLPAFLAAGMQAEPAMRRVSFGLLDRLVLSPMDLVGWGKYLLPLSAILWFLGEPMGALALVLGLLAGGVLTPALLPYLPFRSFSGKGALAGAGLAALSAAVMPRLDGPSLAWGQGLSWTAVIASLSSVIALYFTGASTYTSLSGVRKEIRWALPVQIAGLLAGAACWVVLGGIR